MEEEGTDGCGSQFLKFPGREYVHYVVQAVLHVTRIPFTSADEFVLEESAKVTKLVREVEAQVV